MRKHTLVPCIFWTVTTSFVVFELRNGKVINKIDHGLHVHDKFIRLLTLTYNVQQICSQFEVEDPRVL